MLVPAVCVLPVFFAAKVDNVWLAVLLVGVAAAGHQGFAANLYTLVSDVMPKQVIGSLIGLGGFAAGFASIGMAQASALILNATHSYNLIFAIASPMYLVSVLLIQILVPDIRKHRQNRVDIAEAQSS